ncbi:MAG: response regulator transcription factor [Chloroflexota bacterium]
MIRVLIVEDEPRVRRCLRQRLELEPDLDVVAEAADGDGALAAIRSRSVDVVLMDVRLPGRDGLEVTDELRRLALPVGVVIHTLHDSPSVRARAAELGAPVIAKGEPDEPLLDALRAMAGARPA